jgi:hypothetical protein
MDVGFFFLAVQSRPCAPDGLVKREQRLSDYSIANRQERDQAADEPRAQPTRRMHAHNELTVLNRLFMCTIEYPEDADELHSSAQTVQLWCLLQVLVGKIFETWKMLRNRFLGCNPVDPMVAALSPEHRNCLAWLERYFALKDNALATIRDKAAFHYDKLNTERALSYLAAKEDIVYLAQQPINTVYYLGSSLVFRTLFTIISDNEDGVAVGSRRDRTTPSAMPLKPT